MHSIQIASDLYLIPLDLKLRGFRSFISAWLYQGEKTILVDVGPVATLPILIHALQDLAVSKIDTILLTHIHLDHAGGIGDFLDYFPDTPVVCHASAIKHLANPTRLWEGSLKTIPDMAQAYGPIKGVNPERLYAAESLDDAMVLVIPTPGHAPHHVSYRIKAYLFAGEAAGVYLDLSQKGFYLRPTTPERFYMEAGIGSIQNLLRVPHDLTCFSHFGVSSSGFKILSAHIEQLQRWVQLIQAELQQGPEDDLLQRCIKRLLNEDPLMRNWDRLSADIRKRERYFIKNSIRGFVGYLNS